MIHFIHIALIILFSNNLFCQTTHKDYDDLDTLRTPYNEMIDWKIDKKSKCYENGKRVNCKKYKPGIKAYKMFTEGCPYVYEQFDDYGNILMQTVSCTDCYVGEYKEYYPRGPLKTHGFYKQNETGIWPPEKHYFPCNIKHGLFTYFSFSSDTLLKVIWANNKIINYSPRGDSTISIKNQLMINNKLIDNNDTIYFTPQDTITLSSLFNPKDKLGVEIKIEVYNHYFRDEFKCNWSYSSDDYLKVLPLYDILELKQKVNIENESNQLTIDITYLINGIYITYQTTDVTMFLK